MERASGCACSSLTVFRETGLVGSCGRVALISSCNGKKVGQSRQEDVIEAVEPVAVTSPPKSVDLMYQSEPSDCHHPSKHHQAVHTRLLHLIGTCLLCNECTGGQDCSMLTNLRERKMYLQRLTSLESKKFPPDSERPGYRKFQRKLRYYRALNLSENLRGRHFVQP